MRLKNAKRAQQLASDAKLAQHLAADAKLAQEEKKEALFNPCALISIATVLKMEVADVIAWLKSSTDVSPKVKAAFLNGETLSSEIIHLIAGFHGVALTTYVLLDSPRRLQQITDGAPSKLGIVFTPSNGLPFKSLSDLKDGHWSPTRPYYEDENNDQWNCEVVPAKNVNSDYLLTVRAQLL
jgi:hypothetical protein